MKCEDFKRKLSGSDAAETNQELTKTMREHLETCESCNKFMKLDEQLDTVIREEFQQVEVPERIKERLQQNLMANVTTPQVSVLKWLKVAAPALAMAAMLVIFLLPDRGSFASLDDVGQLAITDHESHLGRACNKGLPADLTVWGKETIGLAITAPELPFPDSELIAVSKCTLGDCDTAHLTYVRNGKRFSVFIFPEKEAAFSLHKDRNYTLDFENYRVTIWKSKRQVYALVT